jgi:hypothetical protein
MSTAEIVEFNHSTIESFVARPAKQSSIAVK